MEAMPHASGWRVEEVSGSFGLSLAAEAGVVLTKASAETTFEVKVTVNAQSVPHHRMSDGR